MKMPVAQLVEHGASIQDHGNDGFSILTASGLQLGVFSNPPDPAAFESDDPKRVPKAPWVFQGALRAYLTYDRDSGAIERDQRLSVYGRGEKLEPLKYQAVKTLAFVHNDLAEHEATLNAQEAQRYTVPPLDRTDVVGALRDSEIRSHIRALPSKDMAKLFEPLNSGDDVDMIRAVMRSPVKFGQLEQFARAGWAAMVDRADPIGAEQIKLAKASIDWGKRNLALVHHATVKRVGYAPEQLLAKAHELKAAHHFGFTAGDIVKHENVQRARAS